VLAERIDRWYVGAHAVLLSPLPELQPMPRLARELTVDQLERALARKKARLAALVRRRARLQNQLQRVTRQVHEIAGRGTVDAVVVRKPRRRRGNSPSLREVVLAALTKNKAGLAIGDLEEHVRATGYKSRSTNVRNVLYQCLYQAKEIKHDKRSGRYVRRG
jgi:hypothetical protein